ncbi:MAG TPA: uroporphyrinogen decarboxylase [Candidatus Bathyarchaeia archaeon]|nr:uroporphyrinogen decarboxylase [Candidatus Bathyarchaeia archaeon]
MIASLVNDNFLRACRKKDVEYTPVWFMRQAGRSLESYRKIRKDHDVLEICKTPELAADVSVNAVRELGVDAAILFADIMLPLEGAGINLKIIDGGPRIEKPFSNMEVIDKLDKFSPKDHVPYVLDAVRATKSSLSDQIPLIGFSGAPFTLASYLIEGGPSRDFGETKKIMYGQTELWSRLLDSLSEMVSSYLLAQIKAGVDAVQLFDSWVGCLSPTDYQQFVLPFTKKIFERLGDQGVPRIHFGVGTGGLLESMSQFQSDVIGVDWRIPIDEAWARIRDQGIQGNLDPGTLLGDWKLVETRTREILGRVNNRPGHIFNLGHGVLPETNPEQLRKLVGLVHQATEKRR